MLLALHGYRVSMLTLCVLLAVADVVATLAKNVKVCVLRLSAGKVCFVISGKGSINMWCELNQVIMCILLGILMVGENNSVLGLFTIDG